MRKTQKEDAKITHGVYKGADEMYKNDVITSVLCIDVWGLLWNN